MPKRSKDIVFSRVPNRLFSKTNGLLCFLKPSRDNFPLVLGHSTHESNCLFVASGKPWAGKAGKTNSLSFSRILGFVRTTCLTSANNIRINCFLFVDYTTRNGKFYYCSAVLIGPNDAIGIFFWFSKFRINSIKTSKRHSTKF